MTVLRGGAFVLLPLAPTDPRSLMQGDYMVLTYALARELTRDGTALIRCGGHVVIRIDARGVRTWVRLHDERTALALGEQLLRYRVRDNRMQLGAEAFFF